MSDYQIHAAQTIERQICSSRTRELAFLIETDKAERLSSVMRMLAALPPGAYLVGCGPYTTGVHRVGSAPILIGRRPLPHEDSKGSDTNVLVNDVPWFAPREVSRVHASILPTEDSSGEGFMLRDESSTTGTYLNGHRVGLDDPRSPPNPAPLQNLDVVWLGPSGVNCYVWLTAG
ncbi:MAG: FHA domain-containing protein [Phycisphaerales bacterium]|nr:FHA domain-containing protein [Phycisphaerales bacterium]